jgi:V/A-type H+/Na+-transporting ATPase subunit F
LPKVVGILNAEAAAGFSLAGVDVIPVADAAEFKRALLSAVESRKYSLVIVDDGLFGALDERTRSSVVARSLPLVVAVAADLRWSDAADMPQDDYVAMLVRRAVGYQLNIHL